jgi:Asp-tRNA(Asn)/Glu-tRNA(Gln) amidotransferase A subunit family amidase
MESAMSDNLLTAKSALVITAAALRTGAVDVVEYVERVCDRLEAVNDKIHALLPEPDVRTRLRHDAEELKRRYPTHESRPPLYGIPIGVKDIFRVNGFPTRAGSALPSELFAGAEAAVVRRLRTDGALVLGKTVTTEFAYFEPGATRNPHDLQRTPGGSSSGSAAAVAAGITPLTLGTQTIASIIRPAAFCGVVGFKPSYGRIDPTGVIFIAPSLDHVGMFTQDVGGMQLTASVVLRDWHPAHIDSKPTLGVPEGAYLQQASPEALQAFEAQIGQLERARYTIKRITIWDTMTDLTLSHRALMAGEMARVHREWFAQYKALYRPRTADMIRDGQRVDDAALSAMRKQQHLARAGLHTLMAKHSIDLWIAPSAKGIAPLGLESTGDPVMSFPWTFAGLPTISLPISTSAEGLPLGLQCIGMFGQDEQVLAWASLIIDKF